MSKKAKIVKASTVSHATRGYYVFIGHYPTMRAKYVKTKTSAKKVKRLFEKGKHVRGEI